MVDLNSQVGNISGWELQTAVGINDSGQIVGNGTYLGDMHGFLLTPITQVIVSPAQGGNAGNVTITLIYPGAAPTSADLICGGTTIIGTSLAPAGPRAVQVTFNLTGVQPGSCNLVLNEPDGTASITPNAFTVVQGGAPDVWVDIVGFDKLRAGSAQQYFMVYGNRGTVDAQNTLISVNVPLPISVVVDDKEPLADQFDSSIAHVLSFTEGIIPAGSSGAIPITLSIPDLAQYAHQTFTIGVEEQDLGPFSSSSSNTREVKIHSNSNSPANSLPYGVGVYDGCAIPIDNCPDCKTQWDNYSHQLDEANSDLGVLHDDSNVFLLQASKDLSEVSFGAAILYFLPEIEGGILTQLPSIESQTDVAEAKLVIDAVVKTGSSLFLDRVKNDPAGYIATVGDFSVNTTSARVLMNNIENSAGYIKDHILVEQVQTFLTELDEAELLAKSLSEDVSDLTTDWETTKRDESAFFTDQTNLCSRIADYLICANNKCGSSPSMHPPPPMYKRTRQIQSITSGDPNDMAGSQGFGTQQYISGATALRYAIQYGNETTASAPAAKVVITDPIDVAHVDLNTFVAGPISFGSQLITPPPIPGDFSTTVDLRPANNLLVSIQTHLDTNTGILTYTLQSLDPATNLPPTDPSAGFLPPGATGSVFFTAMAKAAVTTDTTIMNQATVVFDALAAIPTPTWSNTIDNTAPVSHVLALSGDQSSPSFAVTWSGTDIGSGVQGYTIYVSDNGGAYTAWLTGTTATSATYTGQVGHTYGFYSIATDNVGNVEATKTSADASVQIVPAATTTVLKASAIAALAGQSVILAATVSGPTGNIVIPTGTLTFLSGTNTLGTATLGAAGAATLATPLPVGTEGITAQYSGDANFAPSVSNTISVTVSMIATTTTVVSSAPTANLGANVTFTATVTPATGSAVPSGTVAFSDGTTVLGTGTLSGSNTATYSTATLTAGTHTITAAYSGDANYIGSTSSAFTQTVVAPGYSLSVTPTTLTIHRGQTGKATFTVTPVGGFTSKITFACSGLPAYTTCSFSPTSVTPDGTNAAVTSTLTIATNVKTASTDAAVQTGGSLSREKEALLALLLLGLPGLIWARRRIGRGGGLLQLFILLLGGALLGLASTLASGCGGSTNTPRGTETITVTASGGGSNQTARITLTVQ
jgi:hypothetical protein